MNEADLDCPKVDVGLWEARSDSHISESITWARPGAGVFATPVAVAVEPVAPWGLPPLVSEDWTGSGQQVSEIWNL